ncbi:MAG: pantoate--beta-alanine ligase, partial [bacterium]
HERGFKVGLVPTMGYLHQGHLSLVEALKDRCDRLIISIFVNPTQFSPGEDLDRYPRDFERDERLLLESGVHAVFYPSVETMYPTGYRTFVQVEDLSAVLCGRSRPTHFRGVATVVAKLFLITNCDVAAFGQKDYQQALIIQRMVQDLNLNVEIIVCPIVREPDNLAMSSRNQYLSPEERKRAICLYQALTEAEKLFRASERSAAILQEAMESIVRSITEVRIDYLSIVDAETLQPVRHIDRRTLLAGAIFVGKTRLIDNIILE